MTRNRLLLLSFFILLTQLITAQALLGPQRTFTRADTLRGSLRPERTCYDVTYYELNIRVDTDKQSVTGYTKIEFNTLQNFQTMQIDLYENMKIVNITWNGRELKYRREFGAVFVEMPEVIKTGTHTGITVNYYGKPTIAKRPPWDGGFTWTHDKNGKLWMGVTCEGMGASLWWPNKDYLGDEPDSMRIIGTIPTGLTLVCNGQLEKETNNHDGTTTFGWKVTYPINNYDVTLNIGDYTHFSDTSVADDGSKLAMDYYVLSYNVDKAKEHFKQVKPMMKCYEHHLGKYPFWRDGYKLVETPYLGMEHQGAIAYGNKFLTGYAGYDYSRIGLDFDYIIIHETAHEWWGNSVSCYDLADMWIHESFATYTESIYVECMHGKDTALQYINAKKAEIGNKSPIVGIYGVNQDGSGDMYSKGSLFLNTLRGIVNDDAKWWRIIKGMCDTTFKYRNIGYQDVVNYFNAKTGMDLSLIFDQYLKHAKIPVLKYSLKRAGFGKYEFTYKWVTDEPRFGMPFHISTDSDSDMVITGTNVEQKTVLNLSKKDKFKILDNLGYFNTEKL